VPGGTWSPGLAALGNRVYNSNLIVNGWIQAQKGIATFPPIPQVTTPGTVASGGTVYNSTGYDCMVYAKASTGIGTVVVGTVTITSTLSASGLVGSLYVPYGQPVILSYTGTLTWSWFAV
jgi:hypothetical protein